MRITHTADENNRPASFGIENEVAWIEYTAGNRDRVAIFGHTKSLRNRIQNELISRGIAIHPENHEFLILLKN
jgi:hypothetical protein